VSHALQPVSTAKTVRIRHGKASQVDGPFAETKEHLGGFILINAANMNDAVEIASKIPMAKLDSIEVRPVMKDRSGLGVIFALATSSSGRVMIGLVEKKVDPADRQVSGTAATERPI
jgi:hypothetical protein